MLSREAIRAPAGAGQSGIDRLPRLIGKPLAIGEIRVPQ